MGGDSTFYINKKSLDKVAKKFDRDYWEEQRSGNLAWEKMWDAVSQEEPDLIFKSISIVIIWIEWRQTCVDFRNLLKDYKIEYAEQI